jgi:amino acid transporter
MGQDKLVPASFAQLHAKYQTPALATIVMTAWACLLVVGVGALTHYQLLSFQIGSMTFDWNPPPDKSPFDIMTDFVIFGSVTFETLAVATIFVFRRTVPPTPENRPYRCWGYPIVPALYVAIMAAVLVNYFVNPDSRLEAFVGMGFIASGAVVYAIFYRGRSA